MNILLCGQANANAPKLPVSSSHALGLINFNPASPRLDTSAMRIFSMLVSPHSAIQSPHTGKKIKNPTQFLLGFNLEICWISWKIPVWKKCNLSRVGWPINIQVGLIPTPTLVNLYIQYWKSPEINITRLGILKSPTMENSVSRGGF